MQSVEFSMGPLLIEIERPMNDKLGLILSNYSTFQHIDHNNIDDVNPAGVYVASILAASIADRYVFIVILIQISIFNDDNRLVKRVYRICVKLMDINCGEWVCRSVIIFLRY